MFCISSQSHRFLFHSCTHDVPVALNLLMTHHFNATRAIVPCARGQSGISASSLVVLGSTLDSVEAFPFPRWNLCLQREILSAKHISLLTLAVSDLDVTAGGGTGGLWWTVVVHVYCEVDEQLVSGDTGQKKESPIVVAEREEYC